MLSFEAFRDGVICRKMIPFTRNFSCSPGTYVAGELVEFCCPLMKVCAPPSESNISSSCTICLNEDKEQCNGHSSTVEMRLIVLKTNEVAWMDLIYIILCYID